MRCVAPICAALACVLSGSRDPAARSEAAESSPPQQRAAGGPALVTIDANNVRPPAEQPNLLLQVSADFMSTISAGEIDENDPHFADTIMDTAISGTTHTVGKRTTILVESPDRALMEVQLRGTTTSQTIGLHPPVTIRSSGTTQFTGALRVAMDADGYIASAPSAWACTHTAINSLCICGGRLVQRIATKRVYQSKPEAECIAARHAEQRVRDRIKSNAAEGIAKQNENYQEKLIKPLARWGAVPDLHYSSHPTALFIVGRESGPDRLAGPPGAPPTLDGNPMLGLRVHESFINNMAALTMSGRTFSEYELNKAFKDFFGGDLNDTLDQAARDAGEKPKEPPNARDESLQRLRKVTFTKTQPLSVVFDKSEFEIKLRALQYWRPKVELGLDAASSDDGKGAGNEEAVPVPGMVVTVRYRIEKGPDGLQGTRINFTVEPSEEAKAEWAEKAKRGELGRLPNLKLPTIMGTSKRQTETYFGRIFPNPMKFQGIEFQKAPFSKAGKLISSQVSSELGWLTVGWNK